MRLNQIPKLHGEFLMKLLRLKRRRLKSIPYLNLIGDNQEIGYPVDIANRFC